MLDFPRWKVWGVTLLCIVGILFAIPSFFPASQVAKWPGFIPSARINLGLDLAGGSHLLLEGDTSDVAKQRLDQMEDIMRSELRRGKVEAGAGPGEACCCRKGVRPTAPSTGATGWKA